MARVRSTEKNALVAEWKAKKTPDLLESAVQFLFAAKQVSLQMQENPGLAKAVAKKKADLDLE